MRSDRSCFSVAEVRGDLETDAEHNASLANFYSIFGNVQTCDEMLASLSRGQEATAA